MEETKKTTAKKLAAKKAAAKKTTKKKPAAKKAPDRTLVIVESPAKANTIGKFMGRKYKVIASQGHVRDLPSSKLGVDVENDFTPQYVNLRGRSAIIKEIKQEAKNAKDVLLATDPDREGEAISWHIAQVLGMDETEPCRIEFNEITEGAIKEALSHPRAIDMDRVNAQQARRVLDRLVGYKISPILWRKVRKGLSAGRVQSVAVKIICDRDREIEAFVPVEYWSLTGNFKELLNNKNFVAKLERISGKKAEVHNEKEAKELESAAKGYDYTIDTVKKGQRRRRPQPPFTTSTMQQEASRKLNMSPANTMRIAQGLYEGVTLPNEGAVGLVTYIRTDSMRVTADAITSVRAYIAEKFGKQYVPDKPNAYRNRRSAQDAHEAIRPTSLERTPQSLAAVLNRDQLRLYELIFNRFVASQMAPEVSDTVTADVVGGNLTFRCTGSIVRFDGYRAAYTEGKDVTNEEEEKEQQLPELIEGTAASLSKTESKQHFTQPPPKYTDATLVKALEERGIGRPSTYATIISTIIEREYVERNARQLSATPLGFVVTDLLKEHFTDIVDEEFTAGMEDTLDEIEEGQDWHKVVEEFYGPFSEKLELAETNIPRVELPEEVTDIPCEKCGAMMVVKTGRYGKFLACPNYPECKNTKPLIEKTGTTCPKCGKGEVVKRKSKKNRIFYGCDQYPACDFVSWDMPLNEKCEKCGAFLVQKWGKNKQPYKQCSNPECKHLPGKGGEEDDNSQEME
ncbi:type I DNA topoisomerase [Eubacteriales bacterium OttesenSCG-928-M02]|nr:type I DNA topoisomerase [Eubacteriales bacterium OttesenSCG-928-M02]